MYKVFYATFGFIIIGILIIQIFNKYNQLDGLLEYYEAENICYLTNAKIFAIFQ